MENHYFPPGICSPCLTFLGYLVPAFTPSCCQRSSGIPLCADTPSPPLVTLPAALEQIPAETLPVQPTQTSREAR